MIILHNINTTTLLDLKEMLKYYPEEVQEEFNRESESFAVRIDSKVPVIAKYYNLDGTLRLELGSKIVDIPYYDYSEISIV